MLQMEETASTDADFSIFLASRAVLCCAVLQQCEMLPRYSINLNVHDVDYIIRKVSQVLLFGFYLLHELYA